MFELLLIELLFIPYASLVWSSPGRVLGQVVLGFKVTRRPIGQYKKKNTAYDVV